MRPKKEEKKKGKKKVFSNLTPSHPLTGQPGQQTPIRYFSEEFGAVGKMYVKKGAFIEDGDLSLRTRMNDIE